MRIKRIVEEDPKKGQNSIKPNWGTFSGPRTWPRAVKASKNQYNLYDSDHQPASSPPKCSKNHH
jgi:hypothetical protein